MEEIDWSAWGTWAAVALALWIALRDVRRSNEQRRADTKVLAVLADSWLHAVDGGIRRLETLVSDPRDEIDMYSAQVWASVRERKELAQVGGLIETESIAKYLESWAKAESALVNSLATVFAVVDSVKNLSQKPFNDAPQEGYFQGSDAFFANLRSNIDGSKAAIRSAKIVCRRILDEA